ncbi:MAG TPA: hypothetical protein VF796_20245 [Humisphaera sp.]
MQSTSPRRLLTPEADEALNALSTRQFVRPHQPAGDAAVAVADQLGVCPSAAARSVAWLEIDPAIAVGRLTRAQLSQMARSMVRFARQQATLEARAARGGGVAHVGA